MRWTRILTAFLVLVLLEAGAASAQTVLRIGLNDDPDALDPTISRAYVGRLVFAAFCDKLFDVTPDIKIVPQLATGYEWTAGGRVGRDQAAARGEVPRRRAVQRRGGALQHRAPSVDAGLVPQERDRRDQERRRRQRPHGPLQPHRAAGAADRRADRPRRHDDLAKGGARARRQVRHAPGVRRALQVRRARGAGQDRRRAVRRLLGQGQHPRRSDRVRPDHRLDGAAGQSALGRPADDRARLAHRSRAGPRRSQAQGGRHPRARLPDAAAQSEQRPARQGAGRRPPSAPGDRPRHRPRDDHQDGLQQRVHSGQSVRQPVEPVLQREIPREAPRRRPGAASSCARPDSPISPSRSSCRPSATGRKRRW